VSFILVVDDNPAVREPLAAALQSAGYRSATARDAVEALERARRERPLLILLDVQMPGMSGFELLEAMRGDATLSDIPVLLLTATADKGLVTRAARLGVKGYVLKSSFSMPDLLARVKQHAGHTRGSELPPAA